MEIQLWREILEPYELAVDELVVKFRHLIAANRRAGKYSPIEQVNGRVKTISSILEKCQKKDVEFDQFEERIEDIAGIRIICQFVEDIYKVAEIIKNRTDMKVKSEKDYISNVKDSGYRSYHMIVYYTVESVKGPKEIQVEIQIRTIGMDFWASLEHKIYYKFEGNAPAHISRELRDCATIVSMMDAKMLQLNEEIIKAKKEHEENKK